MSDENKNKIKITEEEFATMCLVNAAWKFLSYISWAVGTLLLFFMMGIVVNLTWWYAIIWCSCFVAIWYLIDIIGPGRNFVFTDDFWEWAEGISKQFDKKRKTKDIEQLKKTVEEQGGELDIEGDKIKRYGRKLTPVNTEESKKDFVNLLDSIEEYEKSQGRDRTVKALADVIAAYSEIMGATETTIDGETYKIEYEVKKKEEQ